MLFKHLIRISTDTCDCLEVAFTKMNLCYTHYIDIYIFRTIEPYVRSGFACTRAVNFLYWFIEIRAGSLAVHIGLIQNLNIASPHASPFITTGYILDECIRICTWLNKSFGFNRCIRFSHRSQTVVSKFVYRSEYKNINFYIFFFSGKLPAYSGIFHLHKHTNTSEHRFDSSKLDTGK